MRWSASAPAAGARSTPPSAERATPPPVPATGRRRRRRSCAPPGRQAPPTTDATTGRRRRSAAPRHPWCRRAGDRGPSRRGRRPASRSTRPGTSRCRPTRPDALVLGGGEHDVACGDQTEHRARGPSTAGTHSRSRRTDDAGVGAGESAPPRSSTARHPRRRDRPRSTSLRRPAIAAHRQRPAARAAPPASSTRTTLTFARRDRSVPPPTPRRVPARAIPRPHVPASSAPPDVSCRAKKRGGPPALTGAADDSRSTTGVSITDHLPTPRCHDTCLFSMLDSRPVGGPR